MRCLRYRRVQALLLLMPFSHSVYAKSDPLDGKLSLSPRFCITSSEEEVCNLELTLNWIIDSPRHICIQSDNSTFHPWCTQAQTTGSYTVKIATSKDIRFEMIDADTQQFIDKSRLRITPTSDPEYRWRYHTPWSLL
ncbi:DUF3019 domain-containing protein [Shewanella sp. AS1]|uniref:DUF3019 domain-containing protein n=1 Tax=Shewanella sp. AS1 TaxID=2907626 RepID=UPI003FA35B0F